MEYFRRIEHFYFKIFYSMKIFTNSCGKHVILLSTAFKSIEKTE